MAQLEPEASVAGQLFVCVYAPEIRKLLIVNEAFPVFVSVTAWGALDDPMETPEKAKFAGVNATPGPNPMPCRVML
jgi:hypothetical protein